MNEIENELQEIYDIEERLFNKKLEFIKEKKYLYDLISDNDPRIRSEIAKLGLLLPLLVYDKNTNVRCEVAKQGYRLDMLINDENYKVRCEVAKQGYKLNLLKYDTSPIVRKITLEKLKRSKGVE